MGPQQQGKLSARLPQRALLGSFMMGLPLYALSRSRQDSINFSISLFAETASALIGLDLDVHGREHLWRHRPAIFMFNHQSNADMLIMASLIRRDIVGVGKRELKQLPVIGPLMGAAGVVFIDRSDRRAAIETMKPLVNAMRDERKSLVIAPEGTRAPTRKLGAFKKGGFHIAIESGVPIVPVVIHNSGDISPKGEKIFRSGTVHVDVLPAIDTSQWMVSTVDDHVAEIRNTFLRALGQPELSVAETAALRRETPEDLRPEVRGLRKRGPRQSNSKTHKARPHRCSVTRRRLCRMARRFSPLSKVSIKRRPLRGTKCVCKLRCRHSSMSAPRLSQHPVIFLLDADRRFVNLLTQWINAHPDPDREHVIICLDLRDDRNPLALEALIDALQRHPQACVAPLRLSWLQADHAKKSGPKLRDVLRGGERRPPSWLCDRVARLNPKRVHLTVGEPGATLDLADRFC